jgi:hypothetical protein
MRKGSENFKMIPKMETMRKDSKRNDANKAKQIENVFLFVLQSEAKINPFRMEATKI